MSKIIKGFVKALQKRGLQLDVDGFEHPVGQVHLQRLLISRDRLASRGKKLQKPQPKGRKELVARQKKARPINESSFQVDTVERSEQ
jgi:hypothetical protein